MSSGTRAFFAAGLVALAGAATLHFMVLYGLAAVWYPAIHLTIFGWITAMIVAVNYHTMPVFAARDFPYPRLIHAHCAAFSAGIVLSTAALLAGSSGGTVAGRCARRGRPGRSPGWRSAVLHSPPWAGSHRPAICRWHEHCW